MPVRLLLHAGKKMTAEVVIFNKTAVALAADSKITVGRGNKQKTYDTVNKLFSLSKFYPIGTMIYGNAEFMGFPWETIIKDYRNNYLKETHFDHVQGYADNFIHYLRNELNIDKTDSELVVFWIVFDVFLALLSDDIEKCEEQADKEIRRLEAKDNILKTQRGTPPQILRSYSKIIDSVIDICFEKEELTEEFKAKLIRLAVLAVVKDAFSSYMSGVVFAGFGEEERFPTVIDYSVEGIISGRFKIKCNSVHDSGRQSLGLIKPFAQGDMIYRFMEGIDSNYQVYLDGIFLSQISAKCRELYEEYITSDEEKEEKLKKLTTDSIIVLREIRKEAADYRKENFVDPVLNMLNSLPKGELAQLAESLVSITALRQQVSEGMETVGGPIDVAIISKGDGFIWINRKHYFDPKFNVSFIDRYLRLGGGEIS